MTCISATIVTVQSDCSKIPNCPWNVINARRPRSSTGQNGGSAFAANAANKAPQDLRYASLKPEELQVVAGVVVRTRCLWSGLGKTLYFRLPSVRWQPPVHCAGSIYTDSYQRLGPAGRCACVHVITARALLRNVTFLRYRS